MANDNTNDALAHRQPPERNPDLKCLDRLVGTWEVSGGAQGGIRFEWMEDGFFLIQRVELEQIGQKIKGIEIIGRERPFGVEPGEDVKSRFHDNMGISATMSTNWRGSPLRFGAGIGVLQRTTRAPLATMATPLAASGCTRVVAGIGRP